MMRHLALSTAALLALIARVSADYVYPDIFNHFEGYDLIINDEFTGTKLNNSLWTPECVHAEEPLCSERKD
jgi:hypothetical protein